MNKVGRAFLLLFVFIFMCLSPVSAIVWAEEQNDATFLEELGEKGKSLSDELSREEEPLETQEGERASDELNDDDGMPEGVILSEVENDTFLSAKDGIHLPITSTSGYNTDAVYLAFGSDRHNDTEAIAISMAGMPETVTYIGLLGDMANKDTYKTSTVYEEVTGAFGIGNLSNDVVDIIYGGHDAKCIDDVGIMNNHSCSGLVHTAFDENNDVLYWIYGISYDTMLDADIAVKEAETFTKWVDETCRNMHVPLIVVCHVPIHAKRQDNLGAEIWNLALNYAATGKQTTESGAKVIRNVVFLHGHNHSAHQADSKIYNNAPGDTIDVQGPSPTDTVTSTIYYSYLTSGYMSTGAAGVHTAHSTLMEITDSQLSFYLFPAASVEKAGLEQTIERIPKQATDDIPVIDDQVTLEGYSFAHSCSFENDLTINYYAPRDALTGCSNIRLVLDKQVFNEDGSDYTWQTTTLTSYSQATSGGVRYYKFAFSGIAAKEMGNEVQAVLYAEKDGVTYKTPVDVYSVSSYAYNRLKNSNSSYLKTLLVDMLNYGSQAQVYFRYNTNHLVNSALSSEQKSMGTAVVPTPVSCIQTIYTEETTAFFKARSVVFGSNIELKYYMTFDEGVDLSGVVLKLTYTSTAGTENVVRIPGSQFAYDRNTGAYTAKLSTIAAKDLGQAVTASIYDGDKLISNTSIYSIESYCSSRLAKSTDDTFKALLNELMKYSRSVKAYLQKS